MKTLLLFVPFVASMAFSAELPLRLGLGRPVANLSLPKQVRANHGEVTLFADFSQRSGDGIILYLVNRTPASVNFPTQDGTPYIKLERQTQEDGWVRVQSHQYSDCGNSYISLELPPGMHFRFVGYSPAAGEKANLRFRDYSGMKVVSNSGAGFVDAAEARAASIDSMSIKDVPSTIKETFAGYRTIDTVSPSEKIALLRMAEQLGEVPAIREGTVKWVETLKAAPTSTPENDKALRIANEILARDWGKRSGIQRLLRFCHASLITEKPKNEFGSLEEHRKLVWQVVVDLGENQTGPAMEIGTNTPDLALWKAIYEMAATEVKKHPRDSYIPPGYLFRNAMLTGEVVNDVTLEQLLDGNVWLEARAAAEALVQRGRWHRLAEISTDLKPDTKMMIFEILGPKAKDSWDKPSLRETYWIKTIEGRPFGSAAALDRTINIGYTHANSYYRSDFQPLFDALRAEVLRSEKAEAEYDMDREFELGFLPSALHFVSTWRDKADTALFRSFLNHKGYRITESQEERDGKFVKIKRRIYPARHAASQALTERGETVPPEVQIFRDEE